MTSNTITGTVRKALGREGKRPTLGSPVLINVRDLEPLGTYRGRSWFVHRKYSELVAVRTQPITEAPPDKYVSEDGDERTIYDRADSGTFARLSAPVPAMPGAKPSRPVDALGGQMLLDRQMSYGIGSEPYSIRGAANIIDRLAVKMGATVTLDTTRTALVVSGPGGQAPGVAVLIDAARPLLVAYLRGEPVTCTVTKHETPAQAVTVVTGGALACAVCIGMEVPS